MADSNNPSATATPSSSQQPVSWMHIGLHGHSIGSFTIDTNGIRWKSAHNTDDDDVILSKFVPVSNIHSATWTIFGKSGHVRIVKKNKGAEKDNSKELDLRFDGFPPSDFEKLSSALSSFYNVSLRKKTMSSTGVSFGITELEKKQLVFKECILEDADEEGQEFEPRDGNEMLSVNLGEISQCVIQGNTKNEIEVQFMEADTVEAGTDQLTSIRFYIPPDPDADPTENTQTAAERFQERIMKIANIRNTAGNAIVEFDESVGTFLTPRGRYNITLYDSFMRMYGSRYDYKIKYDDISRLFLLPKPNEVHKAFVIALDKPIRQGQQRYQMLVLQTNMEVQEININLDEETLKKEYKGQLQPVMQGQLCNLIAKSFKIIANKKVFVPGKFRNADNQECVKCAVRANEGHLFPLEKSFVFIHKPPVLIRFDEVESVEFQRYAGGQGTTRNFDLCVRLEKIAGDTSSKEYTFSGIDRSDFDGLYSFLSGKKIKILNSAQGLVEEGGVLGNNVNTNRYVIGDEAGMDDEDSSDDEDFGSDDGESSEDDDDISEQDDDLGGGSDSDDIDSDLEEARQNAEKQKKKEKSKKSKSSSSSASVSSKSSSSKKGEIKMKKKQMKLKRSRSDETEVSPKKKTKKGKKGKDPNAPKRAMTAFMYYSNAMRSAIKEDNPDLAFGDIAKLIGKKYKELQGDEKAKYDDMAAKDKVRYKNAMSNYTPPSDDSDDSDDERSTKSKGKKKKAKKDPNAPKRALTAFMYFSNDMRPKIKDDNPDLAFGDIAKLVGKKYKELQGDEKAKYDEMAAKDKVRYKNAMANYTPSGGD
jgi:structure-specific recognition protein 1